MRGFNDCCCLVTYKCFAVFQQELTNFWRVHNQSQCTTKTRNYIFFVWHWETCFIQFEQYKYPTIFTDDVWVAEITRRKPWWSPWVPTASACSAPRPPCPRPAASTPRWRGGGCRCAASHPGTACPAAAGWPASSPAPRAAARRTQAARPRGWSSTSWQNIKGVKRTCSCRRRLRTIILIDIHTQYRGFL